MFKPYHTASAHSPYFSRKAWITSRVEAMLFVISSATSQNCCWLASRTSSDIDLTKVLLCSRRKVSMYNFVTVGGWKMKWSVNGFLGRRLVSVVHDSRAFSEPSAFHHSRQGKDKDTHGCFSGSLTTRAVAVRVRDNVNYDNKFSTPREYCIVLMGYASASHWQSPLLPRRCRRTVPRRATIRRNWQ